MLKSLYHQQKAVIQLDKSTTEPFQVSKGVRQGCILSPHLFSNYTEDIMRKVEQDDRRNQYHEVKINGKKIRDLRYADDTALLSTTAEGLKNLVQATKEHSEEKNLMLNIKKTKILDSTKCQTKTKLDIGNEIVENVNHFDYLGATFYGDGSSSREIRKRLAIAKQKLVKMSKMWRGLNLKTNIRLLKACIFPIALYGCEAWTLQQHDIKKIEAFEMFCYRKLLGIKWHQKIPNTEVRKRVENENNTLINQIKKQKLSYFGHIKRHDSLERIIMEGKVEGKRKRGRPNRQWKDDVGSWLEMSVTQAGQLALDRQQYRRCVWAATSQPRDSPEQ